MRQKNQVVKSRITERGVRPEPLQTGQFPQFLRPIKERKTNIATITRDK